MLLGVICDYTLFKEIPFFVFKLNLQFSSASVIIYVMCFLLTGDYFRAKEIITSKKDRIVLIFGTLMMLVAVISSSLSNERTYALNITLFRLFLYYLCFVVTVFYIRTYPQLINFLIYSVIIAGLFNSVAVILDFFFIDLTQWLIKYFQHMNLDLQRHYINYVPYTRPSGFITDPNLAALFTGIGSVLFLLNHNRIKIIYYIYLLVSGIAFTLISSKSAYIVLFLCVIIFLIFKLTSVKEFIFYFVIFYLLPLLQPYNILTFQSLTRPDYYKDEMSFGRAAIWEASYRCFKTSPFIGIGSGVFFKKSYDIICDILHEKEPEVTREQIYNRFKGTGNTSHSLIIAVMVEYGIVGLTILFWFIVKFSIYLLKNKFLISFILFIGLFIISAVSSYAPYYKVYYVICIFLYAASLQDMKILRRNDVA
jgi:O-antigen ligase